MQLVNDVTGSTARWVEYDHLAVHINAQLRVLPHESVKLVLWCQLDVSACTFSFCGRSHTLTESQDMFLTADDLISLPGIWRHEPVQLRKVLMILKKVSDEALSGGIQYIHPWEA
ncbi:TPA: hypothetical protein ACH3X2_007114 [Trebouxia sp. C0005]